MIIKRIFRKKHRPYWIFALLFLIFSVIPLVCYWQRSSKDLVVPSLNCRQDSDCVLVVRTDQCCSCPQAVNKVLLETTDNMAAYRPGQDLSLVRKLDCSQAKCPDCSEIQKAVCDKEGECRSSALAQKVLPFGWQNYQNLEYGFEVGYPENVKLFYQKSGVVFRGVSVNSPVSSVGYEIGFSIFQDGRLASQWAELAYQAELEQAGNFGLSESACLKDEVNRGGRTGFWVFFCSRPDVRPDAVAAWGEWFDVNGGVLVVSVELFQIDLKDRVEEILSTMSFIETSTN